MPIGVASISFTWEIPAGSTERTWEGRGVFAIAASMPGTRLSRIRVVFPEPETPVTTVRRPLGIFTLSGFTVWMAPVEREMAPCSNRSFPGSPDAGVWRIPALEKHRCGILYFHNIRNSPFCDHLSPFCACFRPHFNEPVCMG